MENARIPICPDVYRKERFLSLENSKNFHRKYFFGENSFFCPNLLVSWNQKKNGKKMELNKMNMEFSRNSKHPLDLLCWRFMRFFREKCKLEWILRGTIWGFHGEHKKHLVHSYESWKKCSGLHFHGWKFLFRGKNFLELAEQARMVLSQKVLQAFIVSLISIKIKHKT